MRKQKIKPTKQLKPVNYKEVKVKYTNVFKRNIESTGKYIFNVGGAGSSKSFSLIQLFIFNELFNSKHKNLELLILRKTRTSLKFSLYKDFIRALKEYGLYKEDNHYESDMIYKCPETGSYVLFTGLDYQERIKSTQWHKIYCNEMNEFSLDEFLFLQTRLYRGVKDTDYKPSIYMDLNPEECWIQGQEGKPNTDFIYSNYQDNPFVNQDYIDTLESLKEQDISYYNRFTLGLWSKSGDLVYQHFNILKEFPDLRLTDEFYGIDFGFNNQTAVCHVRYNNNEYYVNELIYQTHLTNSQLIELLKTNIPASKYGSVPIYCDSAEPQRIEEITQAGFYRALPANKDVNKGIDTVKCSKINILESDVNIQKELKIYKWKIDRNGKLTDEPVKFNDHLLDSIRYSIHTHNPKTMNFKNIEKQIIHGHEYQSTQLFNDIN